MRRKLSVILVAAGLLLLGLRLAGIPRIGQDDAEDWSLRLVEFNHSSLSPLDAPSLAKLQNLVDRISEAALNNRWGAASETLQQLERAWQELRTQPSSRFAPEADLQAAILELQLGIWNRNQHEVLDSAHRLTVLIGKLTG